MIHHCWGAQTLLTTVFFLGPTLVFSAAALYQEISTFFVAFRYLLFFYGYSGGDWRQTVNSAFLAISFLILRAVGIVILVWTVAPSIISNLLAETSTIWYVLSLIGFSAAALFNIFLNVHWSWLIVK